jgi:hypothetical protein
MLTDLSEKPAAKYLRCEHGNRKYRCDACERERARRRRQDFADKYRYRNGIVGIDGEVSLSRDRKYFLKRKYGITEEQFRALLSAQGSRCRICDLQLRVAGPRETLAHVDHDHATGVIRGILCRHCNSAVGYLRDSPERARRAADYLEASR